jgi:hypothetical protein
MIHGNLETLATGGTRALYLDPMKLHKLHIVIGLFIPFDAIPSERVADGLTKAFGVEGFGPGFGYSAF